MPSVCGFNCKSHWHIFHFLSVRKVQFWFWGILLCRIWGFSTFIGLQEMLHVKSENKTRIWSRKRWAIAALSYFKSLWTHRKTNQAHSNRKNRKGFSQWLCLSSQVCICTLVSVIMSLNCYWTTSQQKPRIPVTKCSKMVKQWEKWRVKLFSHIMISKDGYSERYNIIRQEVLQCCVIFVHISTFSFTFTYKWNFL